MPFDPNLPQENTPADAVQMRSQLNGLKDLIDAIPVGPPGQNGSDGTSVTGAVMDGVNTLNPGDAAQASVSWDGANVRFTFGIPRGQDGASATPITSFIVDGVSTLNPGDPATVQTSFDGASVRFTFGIPRGNDGSQGQQGSNGSDGGQGPQGPPFTNFIVDGVNMLNPSDPASVQTVFDGSAVRMIFNLPRGFTGNDGGTGAQGGPGPQGPPFAQAVVDSVTTLDPGQPATVQTSFDGSNVRFTFGIPRGQNGNDGGSGPQGQPGEVTSMQLNSAINGTSNNSNGVNPLVMTVSDPPTVGEVQAIASKLDELILALRR
ncbi:MAG: hypothetical protein ACKVY0_19470 [Prosthecobacter sp.]|uniref:hypothetical protein n=1 Tax=Prosthecobacter sp. TaxID=1965333 RepID=UPI0038FF5C55